MHLFKREIQWALALLNIFWKTLQQSDRLNSLVFFHQEPTSRTKNFLILPQWHTKNFEWANK